MTMTLDLERVAQDGPQEFSAAVNLRTEDLDRIELDRISPVRVEGVVDTGDRENEFVVSGTIAYEGDLNCSRCLDPYPFAVHSDFTLRFVPRPGSPDESEDEGELELAGGALEEEYYEEPRIDLGPLVVEQVQLTIPMKPLCEESCLGLCPLCGTNRNRGPCECAAEESDPRWDALRGIREQLAKKKEI